MIEDTIRDAASNFNQTILGSVLVLTIIVSYLMFRFLNSIISELKADLKAEREAHQKTREGQIEDIRTLGHVANSVDGLRSSITDMHSTVRDVLLRKVG